MVSKRHVDQLALFGGPPAFAEELHVGRPNVGDRKSFLARVEDILDRRWFTNNGPYVQEFERRIAALMGVRHCVAVCNATVGLELAIRAVDLHGEVIVPSFTFIATAHALQWQQITPVFCDVDPTTHSIDPARVEELITPRTTGVIGVHLWGRACEAEPLQEIADRRHLKLLFDAAHAFGCSHRGRMVGNFGDAEVFSFHATKFLNTLEGGAIATNNDELAAKVRLMRNFGFVGYDEVMYIGTNGKMDELSAAMGLTQLESLEEFTAVNRRNYLHYREHLLEIKGVSLLPYDERERCNYQYVVLEVDAARAAVARDQVLQALWAENVRARRYFYPGCHRMEPYRSYFPHAGLLLPHTERLAERVLLLPTGTAVSPEQIMEICSIIRLVVSHGSDVARRLGARAAPPAGRVAAPPFPDTFRP